MNRIEQQLDLFASTNGNIRIEKPLRVIEFFSGIGATVQGLKVLGIPFTHWKTCEWAYNSICAYNSIHTKDFTDYSKDLTKEQLIDFLKGRISKNYNDVCDVERERESWLRTCYNNVKATHNLMNICNVRGEDLEIDTNYTHLISWSYPCQDLSTAGKRQGQKEGSGTRSSLCFEFLRIIKELTNEQRKSTILLMENVPQAVGDKNVKDFQVVEKALRDLGYQNHIKVLNGKDYGIAQNRQRVFMVSCFGDYTFPAKLPLRYVLKDYLEKRVDEKYYLSGKQINDIKHWNAQQHPFDNLGKAILPTLTTRSGAYAAGMAITSNKTLEEEQEIVNSGILDKESSVVDENAPLKTELCNKLIEDGLVSEGDIVKHSYTSQILLGNKKCVEKSNECITLTTRADCIGVCVNDYLGTYQYAKSENFMQGKNRFQANKQVSDYIQTSQKEGVVENKTHLRIRKLTPKECLKLMGFTSQNYEDVAKIQSDMAIYHEAGDSIITTVIACIVGEMLDIDYRTIVNKYIDRLIYEN